MKIQIYRRGPDSFDLAVDHVFEGEFSSAHLLVRLRELGVAPDAASHQVTNLRKGSEYEEIDLLRGEPDDTA